MKKYAFVIPSLQPGGMERVMSELLGQLSTKQGLELHLVLYGINRDIFYTIPDSIIIHRPAFKFNNERRLWSAVKSMLFLRRKLKELQPESVLSFGELWNNFVLLSNLGTKHRVFVSDRCQPNKSLGRFHDFLRNWLYPKATGVIAQTEAARQIYQQMYQHSNIEVIGNPIAGVTIDESVAKENIVLSVGRLINTKHHDELIKLFVGLKRKDWKLLLVGGDALRQNNMDRLKALIKDLKAEDQVYLEGNQKDVASYYNRSKIFAFSSSSEGFPNVLGEALSAKLPVVAFDCIAGPADLIIPEDNGFLIDLFDYEEFANKLDLLMMNRELRETYAKNALNSIQRFKASSIAEEIFRFIQ